MGDLWEVRLSTPWADHPDVMIEWVIVVRAKGITEIFATLEEKLPKDSARPNWERMTVERKR